MIRRHAPLEPRGASWVISQIHVRMASSTSALSRSQRESAYHWQVQIRLHLNVNSSRVRRRRDAEVLMVRSINHAATAVCKVLRTYSNRADKVPFFSLNTGEMDPPQSYQLELPAAEPFSSLQTAALSKAWSVNHRRRVQGSLRGWGAARLKVHLEVYGSKQEKPQTQSRMEAELTEHTALIMQMNPLLLHSSA